MRVGVVAALGGFAVGIGCGLFFVNASTKQSELFALALSMFVERHLSAEETTQ